MDLRTGDTHDHLKRGFEGLQQEVTWFLEEESPDWIIYDFAPYWLPSVADGLGISHAHFSIVTPWFIAFWGALTDDLINGSDERMLAEDLMTPPKWVPFPSKLCYREHKANLIMCHYSSNASEVSDAYRLWMILKGSDCMFMRYCYELEPQWLTLLEKLHELPVVPVGLLPPTNIGDEKDETWVMVKKWLNGQQKGHVVYVAIRSEIMVSKSELVELDLGLKLSGLPFFWTLRKPAGSTESDSMELPDRFLERTRDRVVVWTSWVPQLQVLSHESVGGFLIHCGWSSNVEGLMSGHPLIMLPFLVDLGLIARIPVDKQVEV
ncbi:putative soyasaponin III rhamnosyltransferase [Helianthus annuus]|uniref:Putative UDP-glucuronosyl/UDP-glucosyltransferase n=1 Tax=Helianthus annuus TaxID=4232 RepID=A0A251SLF6_HELAN|nr:putative soyasaponin III rhamnosyltransferase [Helianthus annuus]KAJ0468812.1 putative soyasaponin III rhamnosyltransferase [Helianthus annuus]